MLEGSDSVAIIHTNGSQVPAPHSTWNLEFAADFCDKLQIPNGYKQKEKFHANPVFTGAALASVEWWIFFL